MTAPRAQEEVKAETATIFESTRSTGSVPTENAGFETSPKGALKSSIPRKEREERYKYKFHFPGLSYFLYLGKGLNAYSIQETL